MAMNAAGVSGSSLAISTGASLIAPRRAIGRPSSLSSSIAGSSSGSSARAERRGDDQPADDQDQEDEGRVKRDLEPLAALARRRLGLGRRRRRRRERVVDLLDIAPAALPDIPSLRSLGPRSDCLSAVKQSARNIQWLMNPAFRLRSGAMTRRRSPFLGSLSLALAGAALLLGGCRQRQADALAVAVIGDRSADARRRARADRERGAGGAARQPRAGAGAVRRARPDRARARRALERQRRRPVATSSAWPRANGPTGARSWRATSRGSSSGRSRAPRGSATREALGAVEEVVAMTDRVIEIRLAAPRPNLLQLLAQPEFALVREGVGSGPFRIRARQQAAATPADRVAAPERASCPGSMARPASARRSRSGRSPPRPRSPPSAAASSTWCSAAPCPTCRWPAAPSCRAGRSASIPRAACSASSRRAATARWPSPRCAAC